MMWGFAAIAIFIAMIFMLIRLFEGPTLYDRVLAVNTFGTQTVLLIGVFGFLAGRSETRRRQSTARFACRTY